MNPIYATTNVLHDGHEYRKGDKFELTRDADGNIVTTQDQVDLLLAQGLFTEQAPGDVDTTQVTPEYRHADAHLDQGPSVIPHPVEQEQVRIENEIADKAAAEAAAPQQVVQPAGGAGNQPSAEDIAQTLAATGQQQ